MPQSQLNRLLRYLEARQAGAMVGSSGREGAELTDDEYRILITGAMAELESLPREGEAYQGARDQLRQRLLHLKAAELAGGSAHPPLVHLMDGVIAYLIAYPKKQIGHNSQALACGLFNFICSTLARAKEKLAAGSVEAPAELLLAIRQEVVARVLSRTGLGEVKRGLIFETVMLFAAQTLPLVGAPAEDVRRYPADQLIPQLSQLRPYQLRRTRDGQFSYEFNPAFAQVQLAYKRSRAGADTQAHAESMLEWCWRQLLALWQSVSRHSLFAGAAAPAKVSGEFGRSLQALVDPEESGEAVLSEPRRGAGPTAS